MAHAQNTPTPSANLATLTNGNLVAAPYARRIWSSLYELALLFGITFVTAFVVQIVATLLRLSLPSWAHSIILFIVMGIYFTYCWTHGGQTLAQRTWRLKVVQANGQIMGYAQAWWRYTLAYLGILPAFLIAWTQIHQVETLPSAASTYSLTIGLALVNWFALIGTSLAHPQKVALHERLSGTRTVWLKQ